MQHCVVGEYFIGTSISEVIVLLAIKLEVYNKFYVNMCITEITRRRNQSKVRIYTVQKPVSGMF